MLSALIAKGLLSVILAGSMLFSGDVSITSAKTFSFIPIAQAPVYEDAFYGYAELKKICTCESGLTQTHKDGSVVLGLVNPNDIGICQINKMYHKEQIESLEVDIYTEAGNIAFAKRLYDKQGNKPWIWSKPCWDKK